MPVDRADDWRGPFETNGAGRVDVARASRHLDMEDACFLEPIAKRSHCA
jgi:hypothetical protein